MFAQRGIFKRIKELFQERKCRRILQPEIPPMPSWDEIVEIMYDQNLSFSDEVVRVIYSRDKTMRYVVLKKEEDFYTYVYETIWAFDEDEWKDIFNQKDALPGMWETPYSVGHLSIFGTEEEAMKELMVEPEYKQYFE